MACSTPPPCSRQKAHTEQHLKLLWSFPMAENHVEELDGEECFEEEESSEEAESLLYFGGLFRRDEADRAKFIGNFSKCVKTWISKPDDLSAQSMLKAHLPTALRLSINAPFADVREKFSELLEEIKVAIGIMALCC